MLLFSLRLLYHYTTRAGAKTGVLANKHSVISVTVVSVVRLTYLIRGTRFSHDSTVNFANIFIWTSIEVNVAIICGQ